MSGETMMGAPLIVQDVHDSQWFALAQAAGRAGIPVIGTMPEAAEAPWAARSRYVRDVVRLPDTNDVYASFFMRAVARAVDEGRLAGVWLPGYEDTAEFTAEYRDELRALGLKLLSVDAATYAAAERPTGRWGAVRAVESLRLRWGELVERADEFPWPCLLKVFRHEHVRLEDADALRRHVAAHDAAHADDEVVVVQRWIDGPVARMATAMLLMDADSRPVRGFTGRRLAVADGPFGPFGETVEARAEWLPELYEGACMLLSELGWQGFAEVECKQGEDGVWHLLEINRRPSGWMCAAEADGAGLLQAYHRICAEGATLRECVLQRSRMRYLRMVGNPYHAPAWANGGRGSWRRLADCALRAWRWMREEPAHVCLGAWDARDGAANRAMLRETWRGWREGFTD